MVITKTFTIIFSLMSFWITYIIAYGTKEFNLDDFLFYSLYFNFVIVLLYSLFKIFDLADEENNNFDTDVTMSLSDEEFDEIVNIIEDNK